jgi:hypothetical protein
MLHKVLWGPQVGIASIELNPSPSMANRRPPIHFNRTPSVLGMRIGVAPFFCRNRLDEKSMNQQAHIGRSEHLKSSNRRLMVISSHANAHL